LATFFIYNEPSSGQKQYKVLVHSMIVHCLRPHTFYNINYIINHVNLLVDVLKIE